MIKKNILLIAFVLIANIFAIAQDVTEVQVKGIGIKRDDALQDALRAAIGKAVGVALVSETKVENFMVVSDAIKTNTKGYITSYEIIKETPFADRYEVEVKAKVSLSPLKADAALLSKQIGGVRFLVMYDERKIKAEDKPMYDYLVEKINNRLAEKKYRYIEKSRFESLKKEAMNMMQESNTESLNYAQQLGLMSGAQFIILLDNIKIDTKLENHDTQESKMYYVDVKTYDNCTAEGLGNVSLSSDWINTYEDNYQNRSLDAALAKDFDKLLLTFNTYIGEWINNGTPYELRFYSSGTYRNFMSLKNKLKEDSDFGGQMEIVNVNNYTKINVTFKKLPDELTDKVLTYADEIPVFKEKVLDVKLLYGRQINFAPQNVIVPELQNITPTDNTNNTNNTNVNTQQNTTKTVTTPKTTKTTNTKAPVKKPVKKPGK